MAVTNNHYSIISQIPVDRLDLIQENPLERWKTCSGTCQRDLIIKKIALASIFLLNLAAIAGAIYMVTNYFPIPTTAILMSPFIAGAIAGIVQLKFHTFGVTQFNYTSYSNPAYLISFLASLILFAPVMLAYRSIDCKTNYGDPYKAQHISEKLEEEDFEKIVMEYGPKIRNLKHYGFFIEEEAEEFQRIYAKAKPLIQSKGFLISHSLTSCLAELQPRIDEIKAAWLELIEDSALPKPKPLPPDFTKRITHIQVWIRDNLGITLGRIATLGRLT